MMGILTTIFGRLAHVSSGALPYAVFAYAGLVPWTFFASGITTASESLVGNQTLITKIYFPRVLLPIASVLAHGVDFLVASVVMFLLAWGYGVTPAATSPLLIAAGLYAAVTTAAVGTFLSAVNVRYRDVRQAVPFLVQVWLFASPIVYPSTLVPSAWRSVYAVNPAAGFVDFYRWAVLGSSLDLTAIAISGAVAIVLAVGALIYFRGVERSFADVV